MESKKQDWWNWGLLLWGFLLFVPILISSFDEDLQMTRLIWKPFLVLLVIFLYMRNKNGCSVSEDWEVPFFWYGGMLGSLVLLGFSYLYRMEILAYGVWVIWMGLAAWALSRKFEVTRLFAIWGLLWFMCRLPGQLELRLLRLSAAYAAQIASPLLDACGVLNVVQGEMITMGGTQVDTAVITSGIFSFHGVAVLAGIVCYVRRRNLWHTLLLVLSSFVVATVMNSMLITVVVMAQSEWGVTLDQGVWWFVLLLLSYALALLLLFSVDALLEFLMQPVEEAGGRIGRRVVRFWNALIGFHLGGFLLRWKGAGSKMVWSKIFLRSLIVLCLLGGTVLVYQVEKSAYKMSSANKMHERENLAIIDPEQVQFTRPGWKLVKVESEERAFDSIWGAFSFVWRLEYHDTMVIMALDYPFHQWHDVRECYGNLGWLVEAEGVRRFEERGGWPASETDMTLPTGDYGFILCSHSDHLGTPVEPKPAATGLTLLKYKFGRKNWVAPFGVVDDKDKNTFYQTQVMVTTGFPMDEATKQEIRMMYVEFREQTRVLIQQKSAEKKGGAE